MDFALRDFIYIDNKKFDGFIDFFIKNGSCRNRDCDTCGFCAKTFEKVGRYDRSEAERHRRGFEAFIDSMLNGDVFREN